MTGLTKAAYATGDSGFPTRFLLYFWGTGNLPETWSPAMTGDDFDLTPQLFTWRPFSTRFAWSPA